MSHPSGPNLFNTMEVRLWNQPRTLNSIEKPVPEHDMDFPIGLNWLDIDRKGNIHIKAYTDTVTPTSVKVHLDSWAETTLYSAGCTWMDISSNDRDFQWGTFSTLDDHPWQKPQATTVRQITFAKPYAVVPKVVVWLNWVSMQNNHGFRVRTYVKDISTTGFTLYIDSWDDTILFSAGATWIAHPARRSNIASGTYGTADIHPGSKPQQVNSSTITFDKTFEKVPRVFAALNEFSINQNANLRIKMAQTEITDKGMKWHLDTWGDTTMYSATASYIAIQDY